MYRSLELALPLPRLPPPLSSDDPEDAELVCLGTELLSLKRRSSDSRLLESSLLLSLESLDPASLKFEKLEERDELSLRFSVLAAPPPPHSRSSEERDPLLLVTLESLPKSMRLLQLPAADTKDGSNLKPWPWSVLFDLNFAYPSLPMMIVRCVTKLLFLPPLLLLTLSSLTESPSSLKRLALFSEQVTSPPPPSPNSRFLAGEPDLAGLATFRLDGEFSLILVGLPGPMLM